MPEASVSPSVTSLFGGPALYAIPPFSLREIAACYALSGLTHSAPTTRQMARLAVQAADDLIAELGKAKS